MTRHEEGDDYIADLRRQRPGRALVSYLVSFFLLSTVSPKIVTGAV